MTRRRRLLAGALVLSAAAMAIAGILLWRQMSPLQCRGDGRLLCLATAPHRLHPLRAELLWSAAAVAGLIAVVLAAVPRRLGRRPHSTSA